MSEGLPVDHPLRQSRWIWFDAAIELRNTYGQFRRDFTLTSQPASAIIHVTADQMYRLYVNGVHAGRGPARGYQHQWPYDSIDITALLKPGRNWLAVEAHNPGIGTFQYIHQASAGLLVALRMDDQILVTDQNWIARRDPSHRRETHRLSVQQSFQEQIDLRQDDRCWIHDPQPPRDWSAPGSSRPYGVMPWHDLSPRSIPNLHGQMMTYTAAISQGSGQSGSDWDNRSDIQTGWRDERAVGTWSPADASLYDADSGLLQIPPCEAQQWQAVVLDMARPCVGTFVLTTDCAQGSEVIDLYPCEWLDADLGPHVALAGAGSNVALGARIRLAPGVNQAETFQLIGHRYLTVIVRSSPQPLALRVQLREATYPLEETGSFECNDALLTDIFRICRDTQRACMLDAYVDTPWREQAQWWGDARVQAWNTFHLANDAQLLARGIRQISQQRLPNGLTYGHAPTIAHHCILPDFSLIWCITLYDHYWQTGKADLFIEHWPGVQQILDYFDQQTARNEGLIACDPRYWLFLDWADIQRQGCPTLLNLWYVQTLLRLADVARHAGLHDIQQSLDQRRETITPIILQKLFDHDAGLFHDGLLPDGSPSKVHSIQNQTLAIMSQLARDSHATMWQQRILPYLRHETIQGALPSSYWVTYVYELARKAGHDALVLDHLVRHWQALIPLGGCSEWFVVSDENPTPPHDYDGTFSHAWAAHPIFHLMGSLGGIVQTQPAWKQVRFAPAFIRTDHATVRIPSPQGLIQSAWQRTGQTINVTLSLPETVEAIVDLPGHASRITGGEHQWTLTL